MNAYALGAAASRDLTEIWDYIARDSLDAADRLVDRLFDAFEALTRMPGMGHKREDLTHFPVLFWPVDAYLVIYRFTRSRVEIVAITRGGRDIPEFLHQRLG